MKVTLTTRVEVDENFNIDFKHVQVRSTTKIDRLKDRKALDTIGTWLMKINEEALKELNDGKYIQKVVEHWEHELKKECPDVDPNEP